MKMIHEFEPKNQFLVTAEHLDNLYWIREHIQASTDTAINGHVIAIGWDGDYQNRYTVRVLQENTLIVDLLVDVSPSAGIQLLKARLISIYDGFGGSANLSLYKPNK